MNQAEQAEKYAKDIGAAGRGPQRVGRTISQWLFDYAPIGIALGLG